MQFDPTPCVISLVNVKDTEVFQTNMTTSFPEDAKKGKREKKKVELKASLLPRRASLSESMYWAPSMPIRRWISPTQRGGVVGSIKNHLGTTAMNWGVVGSSVFYSVVRSLRGENCLETKGAWFEEDAVWPDDGVVRVCVLNWGLCPLHANV